MAKQNTPALPPIVHFDVDVSPWPDQVGHSSELTPGVALIDFTLDPLQAVEHIVDVVDSLGDTVVELGRMLEAMRQFVVAMDLGEECGLFFDLLEEVESEKDAVTA